MLRALPVLCICGHSDHHVRYLPSGLSPHGQRNLTVKGNDCFPCGAGFVATGAGKGLQQEQGEKEEGAKEKTPKTIAGTATEAARKAPAGGTKGLVPPTKKGSSTKPASKRRGCQAPRYEVSGKVLIELTIFLTLEQAPTQQDFLDKKLARLLAPR
ncbi:hypothetical protein C0993_005171 [Termitomyces sp. T159_Od127]|nr:hypothetical protein C0993_005171 [Termitomyces sp. T159_Od127]